MLSVLDFTGCPDDEMVDATVEKGGNQKYGSDPIDLMDIDDETGPSASTTAEVTTGPTEEPAKKDNSPSLTASQISSWLKNSATLKNHYTYSHGGIKLKGNLGFQGHPATVSLLSKFYNWLFQQIRSFPAETTIKQIQLGHEHLGLIACLLHENASLDPLVDIMETLLPHCVPEFKDVTLSSPAQELDWHQVIRAVGEYQFYGPFDAENVKNKSACGLWEVKLDNALPFGEYAKLRRLSRQNARKILNSEYRQLLGLDEEMPAILSQIPTLPVQVASSSADHVTPVKKSRGRPAKETPGPSSTQKQLHSFFTVVRKIVPEERSGEYFQPFYVKEGCKMAPVNHFADYQMMTEEDTQLSPTQMDLTGTPDFWNEFRQRCKKSSVAWRGKPQASCLGWDRPIQFTAKLLQFHENFRPAYFGSCTTLKSTAVNGRRPFAKETGLDYDIDSDDDWCEEEEINDAEDILSEDEEEEDDDDEEDEEDGGDAEDASGSEDWLVSETAEADGNEDSGVVNDMATFKRQSYKKGQKRRYTQLSPVMHGPYYGEGFIPILIGSICTRVLDTSLTVPIDPFHGSILPDPPKPSLDSTPKAIFLESHLPELASLAHNSPLGVSKLYEIFALKHGRVSKKTFELRLNQIAEKVKQATGKMAWIVRPEYTKLLLITEPIASDAQMAE